MLIIFDIDGTLTHTNKMDAICFTRAISDVLNINTIDTNWHNYTYSSDSGIFSEICNTHLNRDPILKEIVAIQSRFSELLSHEFETNHPCLAVNGAIELINNIQNSNKYKVAIATGGWEVSAKLKLNSANINHINIPKSYSDRFFQRTDIILDAIQQSKIFYKNQFKHIIYVGDRSWDYHAAQQLGIQFIGIGNDFDDKADINAIEDFSNQETFFSMLDNII